MESGNGNEKNGQLSFFSNARSKNAQSTNVSDDYSDEESYDTTEPEDTDISNIHINDFSTQAANFEIEPEIMPDAEIAPEHNVRPQKVQTSGEAPAVVIKPSKKSSFWDFNYHNSLILTFLLYIGSGIAKAFRNSFTVAIFTSFQRTAALFRESFLYSFFFSSATDRFSGKLKKKVRKTATDAFIPAAISSLSSALMKVKTRFYGFILLAFSVTSLLIHFLVSRNFDIFNIDIYAPISCIIIAIVAVFLIIYGGTLSDGIKESFILSTLLFGFLGIKRPSFTENDRLELPISGACIFGVLLGVLTLFFPAHIIIAVIMTAVYTFIVVKYPETGLISLILIIPFVYNTALVYIVSIIAISYIFKLLTGKRTPDFEFADIFVALFMLLTFLSDIFSFGESLGLMSSTAFILVYFLCICTLRDKVWFDRAINSVVLGACVFSAYSIFVTFIGKNIGAEYISYIANTDYGYQYASALSSTSMLGLTLMCGIFYLISYFFTAKSKSNQFGLVLLILASVIYIFREASVSMQIALTLSLILFMLLKTNKTVIFIILAIAILPLLPLFNNGIYSGIEQLLSDELYRLDIWSAVINMLTKYGITGIGNSSDAFPMLYSSYYVGNTVNVPHAHSMILQLTISLGFIGLLLFALIFFFILQGSFSYGRNCADKASKNRLLCYAGMCSVVSVVICGIAENLMYNPRAMLLFWLMCGLTVCARRSAKDLPDSAELLVELDENYYG